MSEPTLTEQWQQEREHARLAVEAARQKYETAPVSDLARAELGAAERRYRDAQHYARDLEFNDRLQESNARTKAEADAAAASEAERVANLPKREHTAGAIRPLHAEDSRVPPATKPLKI